MESTILSKCLDLTRDLKALNTSFDITIKLDNIKVRFTSDDNKVDKKKKSPSQQKRDFQTKQDFLVTRTNKTDSNPESAVFNKKRQKKRLKRQLKLNPFKSVIKLIKDKTIQHKLKVQNRQK